MAMLFLWMEVVFFPFFLSSLHYSSKANFKMSTSYPTDCTTYMNKDGPSDPRFRVDGGHLEYLPKHDSRFPYIYSVPTHALVHSPLYIKKILIHIVDTSHKARVKCAKFDRTLSVPLGPNALMKEYGK